MKNLIVNNFRVTVNAQRTGMSNGSLLKLLHVIQERPTDYLLNIEFVGYEHDSRELFEVPEVREWWNQVLEERPKALKYLSRESFRVALFSCNTPENCNGEFWKVTYTDEWISACKIAGISHTVII